jgi:uncharacterized protein YggT (Ycf19 family)
MSLIDLILNLAGLLLWFNWRSLRFDPLVRTSVSSLAGTLRRAEPQRLKRWQLLAGLAALLLLRTLFYWQIGSAANWVPKLNLEFVVLAFRTDQLHVNQVLLYSFLSFGCALVVFYFWMLALAVINRGAGETDPILKMLRLHLGRAARWPWPVQVLLPLLLGAGLWMALHPLLVRAGVLGRAGSTIHLIEQSLLVGVGIYSSLKHLIPLFLLLYLLSSYVYFGNSSFWDFVGTTGRNLVAPIRWLPLRFARYDLVPAFALAVFVPLFYWPVPAWVQHQLASHGVILWPQ